MISKIAAYSAPLGKLVQFVVKMCWTFVGSQVMSNRIPLLTQTCTLELWPESARSMVRQSFKLWELARKEGNMCNIGQFVGSIVGFFDLLLYLKQKYIGTSSTRVEMSSSCEKLLDIVIMRVAGDMLLSYYFDLCILQSNMAMASFIEKFPRSKSIDVNVLSHYEVRVD